MSYFDSKDSDKIILIGLAESGKTTIIKVVTEGYVPDKKAKYTATLNYERKSATLLGKKLTIFDLGGQVAFLDRFTGELAEFIFSNVKTLVFVIDTVNVSELTRAKYYMDLAMKQLSHFSPTASTFVLLHKMDLISPDKKEEITMSMKNYLKGDIKHSLSFFETSVFSESIFNAFKSIIGGPEAVPEELSGILGKFAKENIDTIQTIQFFKETGSPIFAPDQFAHVSVSQAKKYVETAMHYISNNNNSISTLTVFEAEEVIHFVRFFFNGTSLFLSVSRKAMTEKNESILSMYEKVLGLARQLDLSSGSKL